MDGGGEEGRERVEEKRREDAERAKSEIEHQYKLVEVRLQHAQEQQGMLVRSDQLLEKLKFDLASVSEELEATVRQGNTSDHSTQGRSQLLMQNPKFQVWFSSAKSECLLVDGNAESAIEKTSAMSIVCALLAQSLPSATAKLMAFFCGLHMDEFAAMGPNDLIRSLLAQLISQYRLNTTFVDGRAYDELQRFDLHRLCALMTELVKKLPFGAVLFCLVDGISWYETEEMTQEACVVIQTLADLTHDSGVRAVFKLLITSSTASRHVRKCVSPQNWLSLSSDRTEHDGSTLSRRLTLMQSRGQSEEMFGDSWRDEFDEGYDE